MKVYETKYIRNIALLGHGGAGKTTLTEAMLYATGSIGRLGKVEAGNTVSDFEQEEIKRHFSIRTSLIPIEWQGYKLNILDTPGYFDFVGGVKEAISVADSALIMMKASAGIEVGTEKAWEYAEHLPKMIFVTEADVPNSDMSSLIEAAREKFGHQVVPIQLPWYEGEKLVGFINVLKMEGMRLKGEDYEVADLPESLKATIEPLHLELVEGIAETDEALMEKYFAEEPITYEALRVALRKGVMDKEVVPMLVGSSTTGIGISSLMEELVAYLPAPDEAEPSLAIEPETENMEMIPLKEEGPTSLFVFKTIVDPFIGKYSLFKVKTGHVKTEDSVTNNKTGEVERLAHLYILSGKDQKEVPEICAGDLGAVAKLKSPKTGDTLAGKGFDKCYDAISFPKPLVKMAIFPTGKGDEEKMSSSLYRLMAEDSTFNIDYDKETHETIISGIGAQQLDVIVSMLKNKFKVDVFLKHPTTPYRETIKSKVNIRGKHKKQSGGHGQYGDVVMEFEPSGDLDLPYIFEEKIFGGAVPKQYFPAVEKGLDECITRGVLAGYPVVGLKAILLDGSYHPVDSSEMAFKMATTVAFKEGMVKAHPTLLEPIAHVEITVPDEYTGDIMGDMKKRRGRMIGMDLKGRKQVIIAEVPMAELYTYATDVRSMTQGRGEVDYHFERYEEAPKEVQDKVIAARMAQ